MSKQSEAKQAQGYRTEQQNCSNCASMVCDRDFPAWIKDKVAREGGGFDGYWTRDHHKVEMRHRCGIGGFAIKKTATCTRWSPKV